MARRSYCSQTISAAAFHQNRRSHFIFLVAPRLSWRIDSHFGTSDRAEQRHRSNRKTERSDQSVAANASHFWLGNDRRNCPAYNQRDSIRQASRSWSLVSCPRDSARDRRHRVWIVLLAISFAGYLTKILICQ